MNRHTAGQMDGRKDGLVDGRTDRLTDELPVGGTKPFIEIDLSILM